MQFFSPIAGAALALAGMAAAASAPCPYNYPVDLNTTSSHNGLIFTVISNNPATNNRAVQLRPAPYIKDGFFGGVDSSSDVLLGNLRNGGFYSQARDKFNQLYDLGQTAYLNLHDGNPKNGTARYSFVFANSTVSPGKVDRDWILQAPTNDGTYGLSRTGVPTGLAYGFILCQSDIDKKHGPWQQLFFQTYNQTPPAYPGCEYVGVRSTAAATIINGNCNIGGYRAS